MGPKKILKFGIIQEVLGHRSIGVTFQVDGVMLSMSLNSEKAKLKKKKNRKKEETTMAPELYCALYHRRHRVFQVWSRTLGIVLLYPLGQ